jgi:hypothetical protein
LEFFCRVAHPNQHLSAWLGGLAFSDRGSPCGAGLADARYNVIALPKAGKIGIITISQTTIVCSLLSLPFEAAFLLFVAAGPICDTLRTTLLDIFFNALLALIMPLGESIDSSGYDTPLESAA